MSMTESAALLSNDEGSFPLIISSDNVSISDYELIFCEIEQCLYRRYCNCSFKVLGVTLSHVRITCLSRAYHVILSFLSNCRRGSLLIAMFNVSTTKISCRMVLQYDYESRNNLNMT